MCIITMEYHVLFNGDRIGPIIPERGLRQGCPLSLYLYIICVEGVSATIKSHELRGKLHGTLSAALPHMSAISYLQMTTSSFVKLLFQKLNISMIF